MVRFFFSLLLQWCLQVSSLYYGCCYWSHLIDVVVVANFEVGFDCGCDYGTGVCYDYYYFCYDKNDYLSSICGNNKVRLVFVFSIFFFRFYSLRSILLLIFVHTHANIHTHIHRLFLVRWYPMRHWVLYLCWLLESVPSICIYYAHCKSIAVYLKKRTFFCTCTFIFSVGAKNTRALARTHTLTQILCIFGIDFQAYTQIHTYVWRKKHIYQTHIRLFIVYFIHVYCQQ